MENSTPREWKVMLLMPYKTASETVGWTSGDSLRRWCDRHNSIYSDRAHIVTLRGRIDLKTLEDAIEYRSRLRSQHDTSRAAVSASKILTKDSHV